MSAIERFHCRHHLLLNYQCIHSGVYLALEGEVYHNGSNILITDISEGDGALLCFTDLVECCCLGGGSGVGGWYFPNQSTVPNSGEGGNFYRNRGPSIVRLNRRNNVTSPIGLFCCEVPDVTSTLHRICASIG